MSKKRKRKTRKKKGSTVTDSSGRYVGAFSKDTTISSCWGCGFARVVPKGLPQDTDIQLDDDTRARIKAKADALEKVVALDPAVIAARKKLEVEYANARTEYEKVEAETLKSKRFRDAVRVAEEETRAAVAQAQANEAKSKLLLTEDDLRKREDKVKQEQAKSLSDRMLEAWKRSRVETPDTEDTDDE